MATAFLSYSVLDEATARAIARALEDEGIRVSGPLPPAAEWRSQIDKAVASADVVVVVWSVNAANSRFVQQELANAIKAWARDTLILVKLDATELPAGLRDIEFVDLSDGHESNIGQVVYRARLFSSEVERRSGIAVGTQEPRTISTAAPPRMQAPPTGMQAPRPEMDAPSPRASASAPRIPRILIGTVGLLLGAGALFMLYARLPASYAPLGGIEAGLMGAKALSFAIPAVVVVLIVMAVRKGRRRSTPSPQHTVPKAPPVRAPATAPPAPAPEAPHVFVSYSRLDRDMVDRLVGDIQSSGAQVWIDRSQQGGRHRYARAIVTAIKSSRHVAVMCSRSSFESDHVVREIYVAGDFKKPFIAFELDESAIPDELLYFLTGFPRLPAHSMETSHLRAELARLLA
jgi:TIR domain